MHNCIELNDDDAVSVLDEHPFFPNNDNTSNKNNKNSYNDGLR